MKIAFLTPEFPHPKTGASGGIGTSIMNLGKGLVKEGYDVSVLVYGQDNDEVFTENGMTCYRIKNVKFKGLSWYLTRKKIEKLINTLYREQKIEVVEAPDWTGISSFIRPLCPLVIRLNGSDTYFCHLDHRPVKWSNRFHEKRALQKADALLSVSRFTANLTNELFQLDREFTIIPNSIDAGNFAVSQSAASTNTILYFGTLIRKKGLLELPHIFNEVIQKNKQAKLLLVGKDSADILSGSSSTWQLMQPLFSAEALTNVSYLGAVPYHEIKALIDQAAVCVFPTFAEALPVSWLEAMAMQKAIVASDIGWAKEMIEDGQSGFLVHPENHAGYAARISQLLENENLRKTMGNAARNRILDQFDNTVVTQKNTAFYAELLKKKK